MNTSLDLFNEIVIFAFFLSSVIWIGLTFYSSLISQEYLKSASVEEKKSYMINIQANVMWYMRWSSLISFLLSIYLMSFLSNIDSGYNIGTSLASLLITIMFLNTRAVGNITSQMQLEGTDASNATAPDIVLLRSSSSPADNDFVGTLDFKANNSNGDAEFVARIIAQTRDWLKCETRYDLAIRTNSIFSVPLLALMLYSAQAKNVSNPLLEIDGSLGPAWSSISLWVSIILVIFLELNLVFGKNRNWMNTSKKVILTGLILTAILGYLLRYS